MEPKTMEQPAANPLATAPIGELLRRYSIPTTLTLLVNYLYNIADQIFVGQGVGITGMAATNVAFPLTIVTIALALLLGDGCAANLNLCLGRGEQEQANRIISHTASLMVGVGILLGIAGSLLAKPIVILFGATETSFQAALDYTRIIVWGLPFLLFSSALASIIRADGNPKFTMKCMMLGRGSIWCWIRCSFSACIWVWWELPLPRCWDRRWQEPSACCICGGCKVSGLNAGGSGPPCQ